MKKMYKITDDIFVKLDLANYKEEILNALQNRIEVVHKKGEVDDASCDCFYSLASKIIQERVEVVLTRLCGDIVNDSFWSDTEPLVEELQKDLFEYAKRLVFKGQY